MKAKDILEIICRFVYNVTGILNKCYINKLRWWVNEKTFNNWKHKHPEFLQSLKNGKEIADSQIAKSLFNRAKGYSCKATKFATFNGEITDREEYIENYPPDTTACIFWLKNRQPDKWRDKQDMNIDAKGINIVVGSDEDKELLEDI